MYSIFLVLIIALVCATTKASDGIQKSTFDRAVSDRSAKVDRLKRALAATGQEEMDAANYILSGEHYDEICERFGSDLEYIFGEDWQDKLMIPKSPSGALRYNGWGFRLATPENHVCWMHRLLLSYYGLMDSLAVNFGYDICRTFCDGGEINVKFTQCMEKYLKNSVPDIRLVIKTEGQQKVQIEELSDMSECKRPEELLKTLGFEIQRNQSRIK